MLFILVAVITAILGAFWIAPTTSRGGAVWLGVAITLVPAVAVRKDSFTRWCGWAAVALGVFGVLGTMFGFSILLPAAVILALQPACRRFPVSVAAVSALAMVGTGAGIAAAAYGHRSHGVWVYEVKLAPGATANRWEVDLRWVPNVASAGTYRDHVTVSLRQGVTESERAATVAALLRLPGVESVARCVGDYC